MLSRPVSGTCLLSSNRETLLAAAASAALLAALTGNAEAFPFNLQFTQPEATRPAAPRPSGRFAALRARAAAKEKATPNELGEKAKGILTISVSIDKQHLTLYSDGVPIAHSVVSTGVPGHPTPMGVFSIIQKDRYHHSNIYSGAPMPYMQRITWSGVAMHEGHVTGHVASHGCIRLPGAFARQLWGITKLGVRVVVARSDVTPVPVAHERLFALKPELQPLEAQIDPGVIRAAYEVLGLRAPADGTDGTTDADASAPRSLTLDVMAAYAMAPPQPRAPATRPLKPGPITVFISRKEGKLFVRKGFDPVFDVPVTFQDPGKPLGTHVFTALAVNDDKKTMRWNVMTLPTHGPVATKPARKGGRGAKVESAALPVAPVATSTAIEALDRVSIPQEALDRISELMSPGASLVISDQGLGPETGKGTDFIVLAR
jgi:lipoprotein-anchoring transpeptidase ErfK/SrfK